MNEFNSALSIWYKNLSEFNVVEVMIVTDLKQSEDELKVFTPLIVFKLFISAKMSTSRKVSYFNCILLFFIVK